MNTKTKRDYRKWVVSEIVTGLSRTIEQEIINVRTNQDGSYTVIINGETMITVSSLKKEQG